MSTVHAVIEIDAPPETVYDLMLDPECLHQWVTIHRRLNHADGGRPSDSAYPALVDHPCAALPSG